MKPCVVLTTLPSHAQAQSLVRTLISEGLAACGTILPAGRSIYMWQGALHDEEEVQVVLKSTLERYPALEERLTELHPFDVPECVAVEAARVSAPYSAWLASSTGVRATE